MCFLKTQRTTKCDIWIKLKWFYVRFIPFFEKLKLKNEKKILFVVFIEAFAGFNTKFSLFD